MNARLRRRTARLGLAAVCFSLWTEEIAAWNAHLHRAIAMVAARRLTPETAARIKAILASEADGSLEAISVWADQIRVNQEFRFSSRGHFVEIPLPSDLSDLSRYCPNDDCITASLTTVGQALVDESLSAEKRTQALKFFVHLMADIHQPLHCASNDDAGGNRVPVLADGGRPTNLHAFWDGLFIDGVEEAVITQRLEAAITERRVSASPTAGDPISWARECFQVAKRSAYADPFMARTAAPILLSPGYTQAATEVALEQAAKAAVRTAAELNRVLGSGPRQNITSWFYPSRKPNPPLADPSPKAEASPPQTAPATAPAGSTRVTRSTVYLIGAGLALVLFVPIVLFTRTTRRRDIFVSYRRKTSEGHVGRLCDRLEAVFGAEHVFRDVNSIQGGSDFVETIEQRLATCDVVLAVIGPSWARDPRLKDSGDFVRRELCGALSAGVPVIPVLVQDAVPLEPAELPDDLQPLCRRQAIRVPDDNLFDASMTSLIRAIRKTPRRSSAKPASQNNAVPSNR